jgi:tRNA-splicing ligase RtcB
MDMDDGQIWIANHFGSRGLGHTIASGFMAAAAGKDFTDRVPETEDAVVLPLKPI